MTGFSIIIPLYNKEKTIRSTIESVLLQDYPHFEVVVVDDGSTDSSAAIVHSFSDSRIHYFKKENGGPSSARNYGVQHADNPWILFLDADDKLLRNALTTFCQAISQHSDYRFFSANFYINSDNRSCLFSSNYKTGAIRNPFKAWFFRQLMPRAGASIINKEIAISYPYQEFLYRSEDSEILFRIFRSIPVFRLVTPVMEYHLEHSVESKTRSSINKDFQGHLDFSGPKSLWERICLYELYVEAKNNYPDEVGNVYPDMGKRVFLKFSYHCAFLYRVFYRKLQR